MDGKNLAGNWVIQIYFSLYHMCAHMCAYVCAHTHISRKCSSLPENFSMFGMYWRRGMLFLSVTYCRAVAGHSVLGQCKLPDFSGIQTAVLELMEGALKEFLGFTTLLLNQTLQSG